MKNNRSFTLAIFSICILGLGSCTKQKDEVPAPHARIAAQTPASQSSTNLATMDIQVKISIENRNGDMLVTFAQSTPNISAFTSTAIVQGNSFIVLPGMTERFTCTYATGTLIFNVLNQANETISLIGVSPSVINVISSNNPAGSDLTITDGVTETATIRTIVECISKPITSVQNPQ